MNHENGYKVTITITERLTITRSVKREIRIEPITRIKKNTTAAATAIVLIGVRQDAGNHKAQDID